MAAFWLGLAGTGAFPDGTGRQRTVVVEDSALGVTTLRSSRVGRLPCWAEQDGARDVDEDAPVRRGPAGWRFGSPGGRFGKLDGYGLELAGRVALPTVTTPHNARYLRTKRDRMGHDLGTTVAR